MRDTPLTILLVEDEFLIRMDLAFTLSDFGHQVTEAGNAAAALKAMDAHPDFDVLVTDVDMPGEMNGLALAAEVRLRSATCRIVVISGGSAPSEADLPVGSIFMAKPLSAEQIDRAIV